MGGFPPSTGRPHDGTISLAMGSATTWFVMLRDVSNSIRVQGERRLAACMVVEMETGDVLCVQIGKSEDEALSMALEGAALSPVGPRSHRLPERIGFGTEFAPLIARRIRELGPRLGLDGAELVEGVAAMEAEERFDHFLGHMAGRSQPPGEYASSEEWHMLLELALTYLDREPWKRWGDDVDLHLEVELEGKRSRFAAVVIGQGEIQRGLVMYPGDEVPPGLRKWKKGRKVHMPDGTLMFHLDPPGKSPADLEAKAYRYAWPADAAFVPVMFSILEERAADLGYHDVVKLALGIRAVIDLNDRGPTVARAEAPVKGRLRLPDGTSAFYELRQRPPEEPELGTLHLRMHTVGTDLVPEGSRVSVGSAPTEVLPELRRRAKIHRPAPSPPPGNMKTAPLMAIHPRKASGDAIAARIANDDPLGVHIVEQGKETIAVLACVEAAHALMEIASDAPALALFQLGMKSSNGYHVVVVADENTNRTRGRIYGMFECVSPGPLPSATLDWRGASKPRRRGRRK